MMTRCSSCGGEIEGTWRICPLCRVPLEPEQPAGEAREAREAREAYPTAALRFDRRRVWAVLVPLSVAAVAGSFAAQALVPQLMAPVRTVWLSLATLWLVVLAAIHRRNNVSSLVVWLVVLLSLSAVLWERSTGGTSWATTWAIPAICTFANLALGIVVRVVRLELAEHIAKAALVMLFGLVPGVFVLLGWVSVVAPSLVCVWFSLLLLLVMALSRPGELRAALHRRFQA
ncbi:hypothetical protein GA0111570_10443 [Raineyella antarctica]|uniref:Uncharacterized protein n=1 Tax=Raineyella antarctica TaxID=1577474 RepID=A0A1G6GLH4_9ACTN|nr:DUF6320 domain-containing protein [Raineyella antarctica]SDB82759.1 hypothetical protein GA0111570_10443 [Raineyella antarctica]